jgi:ATP-dependent RNA helicase HelY
VVTADRQLKRLAASDFHAPATPIGRVRVPRNFNARSPQSRRDLVSSLRNLHLKRAGGADPKDRAPAATDDEIARLRAAIRDHPCHACPDREHHARWAERYERLRRDTDGLERRVRGRTSTLGRTFDKVCDVLERLRYLDADEITPAGRSLARLYSESDLVVAESLRTGAWDALDPAELAAVVSSLVYEPRRDDDPSPKLPPGRCRDSLNALISTWSELHDVETDVGLDFLREPDIGFAWLAWRWAKGHPLDAVLLDASLAPGDFVRVVKQLIDLLDQISVAVPQESPVRKTARKSVAALRRGVVAYSALT